MKKRLTASCAVKPVIFPRVRVWFCRMLNISPELLCSVCSIMVLWAYLAGDTQIQILCNYSFLNSFSMYIAISILWTCDLSKESDDYGWLGIF